jgi:hypothetical protein
MFATGAFAVATVELSTSNGAAGGTVKLTMSLTGQAGDPAFAGAQVDLIVDRSQLGIDAQCTESATACDSGLDCEDAEACGLISCARDPRLPAALQLIANSPRFQNVPTSNKRLRLGIVGPAIPVTTFEDGVVLTCDLDVPATAGLGIQSLSADRLVVSDANGDVIPSEVVLVPGRIVEPTELTPPATATPTPTATRPRHADIDADRPPNTSTFTRAGDGTPTSTPTAVAPTAPHGNNRRHSNRDPSPPERAAVAAAAAIVRLHRRQGARNRLVWLSLLPVALLRRDRGR